MGPLDCGPFCALSVQPNPRHALPAEEAASGQQRERERDRDREKEKTERARKAAEAAEAAFVKDVGTWSK